MPAWFAWRTVPALERRFAASGGMALLEPEELVYECAGWQSICARRRLDAGLNSRLNLFAASARVVAAARRLHLLLLRKPQAIAGTA